MKWVKLAVRVITTAAGRRWWRGLMIMLRCGIVIAVESVIGIVNVMIMYSIMIVRMMKRRMAKRFLDAVQWNMRRFRVCVAIYFTCLAVLSVVVVWMLIFVLLIWAILFVFLALLAWRAFRKAFSQLG